MEIPVIGVELGLNAAIVLATALIAVFIHLSMNSGKPTSPKLDESAFESLVDDKGWDDEGESVPDKPTAADANAAAAKLVAAQKMMAEAAKAKRDAAGQGQTQAPPPLPKKVNEGPFNIGDRVILKGLVTAKDLNGRHGAIADLWDKETQRYPVDLDLFDPRMGGAVSVKATNMDKEQPISDENEKDRAAINNGVLDEQHGRAVSFICTSMRQSVANTVKDTDIKKVANFCWTFWQTPNGKGVYPTLLKYLTQDITKENNLEDIEKQLNPTKPEGSYQLIRDALVDTRAVKGWNVRIAGEFWIIGGNADGTIVIPACNSRAVYCVVGLKLPLAVQIMQQTKCPRPPKFNLTLLPWYGRLVHDPFISTTSGNERVEVASPQLTAQLIQAARMAEAEGRVIKRLAQLEVPGGSTEGVPFVPFAPSRQPEVVKQEPATQAELALIDNVPDFEPVPLQPPGPNGHPPPMAAWNFVRKGVTEEENPDHEMMIISASGQQIDTMKCKEFEPTAAEVMKKMLGIAAKVGKRPSIMGVDCPKTVARLQFLLKDTRDMRIVGISVTRKKGPPPGAAGAGASGAPEPRNDPVAE